MRRTNLVPAALAVALSLLIAACGPSTKLALPEGLTVEEYALRQAPTIEPLAFEPVQGSMESVYSRRAVERSKVIPVESLLLNGEHSFQKTLGAATLTATEHYSAGVGWVTLTRAGTEIYRIDTGMASPITGLRGLWIYDDHWLMETAYVTQDAVNGRLTRDGELLNNGRGYEEAFNFQLMKDKPFYFFKRDGRLGLSYADQDVSAGYDEIPHYNCCSASELNPLQAENMVAFFARRAGTWYYVEVGAYE